MSRQKKSVHHVQMTIKKLHYNHKPKNMNIVYLMLF